MTDICIIQGYSTDIHNQASKCILEFSTTSYSRKLSAREFRTFERVSPFGGGTSDKMAACYFSSFSAQFSRQTGKSFLSRKACCSKVRARCIRIKYGVRNARR